MNPFPKLHDLLTGLGSAIVLLCIHALPRATQSVLALCDRLRHETPASLAKMLLAWIVLVGLGVPVLLLCWVLKGLVPGLEDWGFRVLWDLSSSSTSTRSTKGKVGASQCDSLFFSRLPLEVRLMIYREVLGGSTVHVFLHGKRQLCEPQLDVGGWGESKLWCFRCGRLGYDDGDGDGEKGEAPCWSQHRTWLHGVDCARAGEKFPRQRPLSLLLSCRRVYTEAIDTLYTTNTFDFDCADSLHRFIRSVPRQRLASIRSVRFYIHYRPTRLIFPFIPQIWTPLWEALSSSAITKGLERVHAIVNVETRVGVYNDPDLFTYPWTTTAEVDLFRPLGLMARREGEIKEFKLDLRWALDEEAAALIPEFCKVSRVDIRDD